MLQPGVRRDGRRGPMRRQCPCPLPPPPNAALALTPALTPVLTPALMPALTPAPTLTPPCLQLFHRDCLARHKEQAPSSPSQARACPLCRSVQPTGLTPSTRPQPQRPGNGGGFVSAWQLHSEMVRRASAARSAVQRSLAARNAQAPAAAATMQAPFASPGTAYNAVSRAQRASAALAAAANASSSSGAQPAGPEGVDVAAMPADQDVSGAATDMADDATSVMELQ